MSNDIKSYELMPYMKMTQKLRLTLTTTAHATIPLTTTARLTLDKTGNGVHRWNRK